MGKCSELSVPTCREPTGTQGPLCYTILYKGLEHPRTLANHWGPGINLLKIPRIFKKKKITKDRLQFQFIIKFKSQDIKLYKVPA